MSLRFGSQTTVVISSASLAKQVLHKYDTSFSHRFIPDVARYRQHCQFSMVWLPPDATWRNLRKIANSQVFFSSRLDASSHLRRAKVHDLVSFVDKCRQAGEPVDVGLAAFKTTLNLLSNTFFSQDFAELTVIGGEDLKELVRKITEDAGKPNLSDLFPLLKRLDLHDEGLKWKMDVYLDKFLDVFDAMIDKRSILLGGQYSSTTAAAAAALDALLLISQDDDEGFSRDYIRHMLLDLFLAGTDTTSSTLEWAMAELLHNPTKMIKAKQELELVIGLGNPVEEADISKLPYLNAVIKETFRMHPAAPFLIPRKAETNVNLSGFTVPKHSQVLVNVCAIGKDPNQWENANSFHPERFLLESNNIDVKGQHFELIPFGSGRRICPGMPLAMRMLPMMLASLIHLFNWKLQDGITPESLDMDDKFGFTLQKAHPLRAIPLKKL